MLMTPRVVRMPRYLLHVVKREVVELGAEIHLCAESFAEARAKAVRLHQEDKIDERTWYEVDSWYTDDPLEITSVQLDGLF